MDLFVDSKTYLMKTTLPNANVPNANGKCQKTTFLNLVIYMIGIPVHKKIRGVMKQFPSFTQCVL